MAPRLFIGLVLLAASALRGRAADEPVSLAGVSDLHCHTAPDAVPRSINGFELARLGRDAGMRPIVLKDHYTITADRAQMGMHALPRLEVFRGIALNRPIRARYRPARCPLRPR